MSLGKNLKYQREKRNWSQKYVADKLGITNTVLSNYERDYRDPDTDMLKKLANIYEVPSDYLLGISNDPKLDAKGLPYLTKKDEKEVSKDLEKMMNDIDQNNGYSKYNDGEPMTDEDRELLRISVENSLRLAKQLAKKKFTPKKYREE